MAKQRVNLGERLRERLERSVNPARTVHWEVLRLHSRSAHLAWVGDVLRLILHSSGESRCQFGRNYPASRPGMDAADGAQRDRETWGFLEQRRYALHDRDTKFCSVFQETLKAGGITPIQLPSRSPNLNAHAERFVRSIKESCLERLILFGQSSLRTAVQKRRSFFAWRNPSIRLLR